MNSLFFVFKTLRRIFFVGLIFSCVLFFISSLWGLGFVTIPLVVLLNSIATITGIISMIGFVFTSILSVITLKLARKKDVRESEMHELERLKKEMEITILKNQLPEAKHSMNIKQIERKRSKTLKNK